MPPFRPLQSRATTSYCWATRLISLVAHWATTFQSNLASPATRVVDVKQMVSPKSSPPMKKTKSSKPSPKVSPVHESDAAYFTVKTHKGESKESSPVTSVHISPIKFKEQLKRSYQASDFKTDIDISPSLQN